jgi:hypothetical protein
MQEKIKHLITSGAIKVVPLPPGRKGISCTWAHKRRYDAYGNFTRVKSRICPHGFRQVPSLDYDEDRVSAPTQWTRGLRDLHQYGTDGELWESSSPFNLVTGLQKSELLF